MYVPLFVFSCGSYEVRLVRRPTILRNGNSTSRLKNFCARNISFILVGVKYRRGYVVFVLELIRSSLQNPKCPFANRISSHLHYFCFSGGSKGRYTFVYFLYVRIKIFINILHYTKLLLTLPKLNIKIIYLRNIFHILSRLFDK